MAVLGQISAGLAHELNQPLAALRTLSDNAVVLMDKQRLDETRGNLQRISHLVGRLGELTRRLKTFAHKPGDQAGGHAAGRRRGQRAGPAGRTPAPPGRAGGSRHRTRHS
jgi:C4-dicarboxylate-specific signal transduction histidine kinase